MNSGSGRLPDVLTTAEMSAPCLVLDVDLAETVPSLEPPGLGGARCAWVLVRFSSEPLGTVIVQIPRLGMNRDTLSEILRHEFASELEDAGRPAHAAKRLATRNSLHAAGPEIAVVVCTRERPDGLEKCLASLMRQTYPRFRVVVVDNARASNASERVVAKFADDRLIYVVEPTPGLSWARNRGLRATTAPVIAWIDDDEIADSEWLTEIACAFSNHPEASAVSGMMLPAELDSWPQVRFEQYGGHSKHRGFRSTVFSPETWRTQHPLYPLPPFGTGGNMAFRRESLTERGGFDLALGAGSPAMGGEDTKIFSEILGYGGTVVYQPTALTFHFHRRDEAALTSQMLGYGVGLTAFYTSMLLSHPKLLRDTYRLIPNVCRDILGTGSLRSGHLPPDFPRALRAANRRGLIFGPGRYLKERLRLRAAPGRQNEARAPEVSHGP